MKLNFLFFSIIISLFCNDQSFSTDKDIIPNRTELLNSGESRQQFVRRFVPSNSSQKYVEEVANCYQDALNFKREIRHDDRPFVWGKSLIAANSIITDYGWSFPPVPRIQIEMLKFCAEAESPVIMLDVGAGYGVDSLFALLTRNIKYLFALEKQKQQISAIKKVVCGSIQTNVDSNFPIDNFEVLNEDFLQYNLSPKARKFDVLNVNKVIHFFDDKESNSFTEKCAALLNKKGRLFITCLTPTPNGKIDDFMKLNSNEKYPGYLFYKQSTSLEYRDGDFIHKSSTILEVRKPTAHEKSAHFYQVPFGSDKVETHRVLHYHTRETLERMLAEHFTILKAMITTPDENVGTDYMISLVAEKK